MGTTEALMAKYEDLARVASGLSKLADGIQASARAYPDSGLDWKEFRARLGDPDATNLSLGINTIQDLGFFSDGRLETWPRPDMPVGISVAVTDQPNDGDIGVRLATDIGWRARPWVQPTVRVSWQGRSAAHSGVGGGLGLVFDW